MSGLEVDRLAVSFGGVRAVVDVSLGVAPGEVVVLVGANGAGKTTTLRAVSGLCAATGDIRWNGASILGRAPAAIVDLGIAQVLEGRQLFPKMTVAENLWLGGYLRRARRKENLERVLERFPKLRERSGQLAGTLSGGEQQMVAIGRALMAEPRLLMLDEPSLGLAPIVVDEIFGIVRQVREEGVGVLLVEQNVDLALAIGDRGYVLENGHTTLSGPSTELLGDPRVRAAYLGA